MEARLYILNVEKDPAEADRIAAEAAQRIESKQLKLLELVQSIGEHLTDEDTTTRAKAIGYLAAVLDSLNPRALTRHQIPVVSQFLCDRLEDEAGLKSTTTALTALAKMEYFGKNEATMVATALVKVDLPKHPPSTRFMALSLVDALMARHRDALKEMGDTWITGLADLVGGEKDPRNLMIVFSVMKVILVEFEISNHEELMFDIIYCYFPIAFRPPPNDPHKITAQDLKSRLRGCLAATPRFAGLLFPRLIEKLDSTTSSVKLDVLQTMSACVLAYGPGTTSIHCSQIWDAVKFELLVAAGDEDLVKEALGVLKSVAISLSSGIRGYPSPNTPLARYLKAIVTECLTLLKEPQQKQAKPAGQILATVATASAVAHSFIVKSTFPVFISILSDAVAITKRRALMESLNLIFEATGKVYGTWSEKSDPQPISNSLGEYSEKLFEVYSQALMGSSPEEISYRLTAMRGLGFLTKMRDYLADSEIGMVVQYLDDVALEWSEKEEVRDEALRILREISTYRSKLIMDITFPAFMARLPDSEEYVDDHKHYRATLEALAKLSSERPLFEVMLTRLLNKLDVILQENCSPDYPRSILLTVLYVLRGRVTSPIMSEEAKAYYQRLIPRLVTKTVLPLIGKSLGSTVLADEKVVDVTGRLMGIILQNIDDDLQKSVVSDVFNLIIFNQPSCLLIEDSETVATNFKPLDINAESQQSTVVVLLAYVLAASRREIALPFENLHNFLQKIITVAENPKSPTHRLALLRIIGLIVNKWMTQKTDIEKLEPVVCGLMKDITTTDGDFNDVSSERLRVVFWVVKALLMRVERLGLNYIPKLIDLLGDQRYGEMVSRGFGVLMGDDELLNKRHYAVVRLLAKQQVFSLCLPKLVDGFKSASVETKHNFLIALSNILRNVSSSVIKPELPALLPLLLQSLDLSDAEVKAATIETLHVTLLESADALKDYASSVITRLLTASEVNEGAGNSPAVRISALKCLESFPEALRTELILPYKRDVLRKLMTVLDDPKRTVRKAAVDCRHKWFHLGEQSS